MSDALLAASASDHTYLAFAPSSQLETPCETLPPAPLPEVLGGRYRIERLLGVGGMGAVYRTRDLLREQFGDPQPYVALKTLNDAFVDYPDAHALLYSEFALTSRLRHPHVVRPFGFEVDSSCRRAFLTLELLTGPTLDQLLAEHPAGVSWPMLQEIAVPLLDALRYAHRQGVLHGDIKPSNVILAETGLRLFDFGLGQPMDERLPGLPRLARQRIAAWTARYAAPELLEGDGLTPRADLYSVACVLFELASGSHPFRRLSARQAKALGLERQLARPATLPHHCWPVLRAALAFEPGERPDDIGTLLNYFSRPAPSRIQRWLGRSHG